MAKADGLGDWSKALEDVLNGIYIFLRTPRIVPLIQSDPELKDFFFANGGMTGKRFEMLSYCTGPWNSLVTRIALEAVLLRSTKERLEVEKVLRRYCSSQWQEQNDPVRRLYLGSSFVFITPLCSPRKSPL